MKRKIAAIVAADIADYSRLVAADEEETIRRLADHRAVFDDLIKQHKGRIFNTAGDAVLSEFESVVEAVRAAVDIQESLRTRNLDLPPERKLQFRMGISIGDVIERDGDLLGDGVNIAARLESLAMPGGICVSRSVHEAVANKISVPFRYLGEQKVKNLPRPIDAFQVTLAGGVEPNRGRNRQQGTIRQGRRNKNMIIGTLVLGLAALVAAFIVVMAFSRSGVGPFMRHPPLVDAKPDKQPADGGPVPPVASAPATTGEPTPAAQRPNPAPAVDPKPAAQSPGPAPAPVPAVEPKPRAQEPATPAAEKPAATAPPGPGGAFRDCANCPELMVLAAGTFDMGSGKTPFDRPVHRVALAKPFAIGRTEITFDDWGRCLKDGACKSRPDSQDFGEADHPVINVMWSDAKDYVAWLSKKTGQRYRLPSEAEWEYAAHGGTTTDFPWGATMVPHMANCTECGDTTVVSRTLPVKSFPANGYGLYDMAGNAAEWVEDCWNPSYAGAPADGSPWLTGTCEQRVLRGGSFDSGAAYVKPTARFRYDADVRYWGNGFRVVRELP